MIANILLTILLSSQMFLSVNINNGLILGAQENIDNTNNLPQRIINNNLDIAISAESVLVIDVKSGKILYEKNANQQMPIASITKLMSMLIFLDTQPDFNKEVNYSLSDLTGGEKMEFKPGEKVKIQDLFYSSLIASTNNTVKTLVRSTGIGKQEFVNKMNEKAKELGMTNTYFKDTTGLSKFNVSTANDIVILLKSEIAKQIIQEILAIPEYTFTTNLGQYKIQSTNLLLNNKFFNIQFGKTGYIEEAGWCFTSFGKVKDNNIITVVLGSSTQDSRFQDTKTLYWWVQENFKFI